MKKTFENNHVPEAGKYCNTIVVDPLNGDVFLYDVAGTWTRLGAEVGNAVVSYNDETAGHRIGALHTSFGNNIPITETITSLLDNGDGSFTYYSEDGTTQTFFTGGGSGPGTGDVVGPSIAGDDNIAVYDGITGKLIKDSSVGIGTITSQIGALQTGKEDAFSKGSFIAGPGVSIGGATANRLYGSGDITISSTDSLEYYNVLSYGATGDGSTDDTAALQAAIDAAETAGGGIVFLPAGTYVITDEVVLKPKVSLRGASLDGARIYQSDDTKRGLVLDNPGAETVAGFFIEGLTLEGPNSGATDGLFIEGSPLDYLLIRDFSAVNWGATGVHLKGAIVSRLEGVLGVSNGAHGIHIDGTDSWTTSVSLISCYGNGNVDNGIRISKATYISLSGCAADNNDIGYNLISAFGVSLSGCGAEVNRISFRLEGDGVFGGSAGSINGCYSYTAGEIGFLVTGFFVAANFVGCHDNVVGADYSLQVDSNAVVSETGCTWSNPKLITGAHVDLMDQAGDSHLRNVSVSKIRDLNNADSIQIVAGSGTPVNFFTVTNAPTGQAPLLAVGGADANLSLYLASKGTGDIRFAKDNGDVLFTIINVANPDNIIYTEPIGTGFSPVIGAAGVDANINVDILPKGTGTLRVNYIPVATVSDTQTLTNKRITRRVTSIASSASITPNTDNADIYEVTALAANTAINYPAGTPTDGQPFIFKIRDNGTSRTITWNAIYVPIGVTLPTATIPNKWLYIGMMYDTVDAEYHVVSAAQEA